jgi:DNA polymerase V
MQATAVGEVWGIGRKTTARLNQGGIRTVLDLVRGDATALGRQFSVVIEKTILELRGTACLGVNDAPQANQQIMCSRSFGAPVTDLSTLIEVASQFTSQVARKLRDQGSVAGAVHVFIATSPYRRNDRQHAPKRDAAADSAERRHAGAHQCGGARAEKRVSAGLQLCRRPCKFQFGAQLR